MIHSCRFARWYGALIGLMTFLQGIADVQAEDPPTEDVPSQRRDKDSAGEIPANFRRENLVAWCIVPFDSMRRSPAARAAMLNDLGIARCAYDWREEHVPTFEQEIEAYNKHGIQYFAFWEQHDEALRLFKKHGLRPQIWHLVGSPNAENQQAKLSASLQLLTPIAERCATLGCTLGLYNHGGWGGEPDNLVALCQALHQAGHTHVGIVYNFHHGHEHIHDFGQVLDRMKPYLLCLNLNGMVDLSKYADQPKAQQALKIQPIGRGKFERDMIQTVIASGYAGPIGVIGHVASRDVAEVLKENIEGLEYLLGARQKPRWLEKLEEADYLARWTPKAREGSRFAYEREDDTD